MQEQRSTWDVKGSVSGGGVSGDVKSSVKHNNNNNNNFYAAATYTGCDNKQTLKSAIKGSQNNGNGNKQQQQQDRVSSTATILVSKTKTKTGLPLMLKK